MTDEEQIEEQNAYYMAGYPSRRDFEKKMTKEEELEDKLTKAKEIIENIIRVTWGEGWNYSLDWKVKAEQFLNSEVGK